jgi:hypothetical protein
MGGGLCAFSHFSKTNNNKIYTMRFFSKIPIDGKFMLMCILLHTSKSLFSQPQRQNISVGLGYAIGEPDKRFGFLYDQYPSLVTDAVINNSSQATFDDEYSIGLRYANRITKKTNIGISVAYLLLIQDFGLPADGNGYFMETIRPFFWRDLSRYHICQLSPFLDVYLVNKHYNLGINAQFAANSSFKKHINNFDLNRWKIEYFASELYPGLFVEYKKMRLDLGFRLLHWKYRDDAIANNSLNIDKYNPFKMRLQFSYLIAQK